MRKIKYISKLFPLAILILAGFFFLNQEKLTLGNTSQTFSSPQFAALLDPANLNLESQQKTSWFQNIIPTAYAAPPFDTLNNRKLTLYGGVLTIINGTATTTDALEIGQALTSGLGFASTNDIYFSPDSTNPTYRAYFAAWKEAAPSTLEHVFLRLTDDLQIQDGATGDTMYIGNAGRDIKSTGRIYIVPQSSTAASNFSGSGNAQYLTLTGNLTVGKAVGFPAISFYESSSTSRNMGLGFAGDWFYLKKESDSIGYFAFRRADNVNYMTIDIARSRLYLNNMDTGDYAKLTVNNPKTDGKHGAATDTIYAYANSSTGTGAAISAEQAGTDYAGYFSGKLLAYRTYTGTNNLKVDTAPFAIQGIYDSETGGGAGVYGKVEYCGTGKTCAGVFGWSAPGTQYAAIFQGKTRFHGPAQGQSGDTFTGGNVQMLWGDVDGNPVEQIGGTNLFVEGPNVIADYGGSPRYSRGIGVIGGNTNEVDYSWLPNESRAIEAVAGQGHGTNIGLYAEAMNTSVGYNYAGYFKAGPYVAGALNYAGYFEGPVVIRGELTVYDNLILATDIYLSGDVKNTINTATTSARDRIRLGIGRCTATMYVCGVIISAQDGTDARLEVECCQ